MSQIADLAAARQARQKTPHSTEQLEKIKEDWIARLNNPQTPNSAFRIASALCPYMNRKQNGEAFPGIASLMEDTGLSRSTVIRALQWLERHGFLEVIRRRVGPKNLVNHYWALFPEAKKTAVDRQKHDATHDATNAGGSVRAMTLPSVTALTPEPLTEPLTLGSDRTFGSISALRQKGRSDALESRLPIEQQREVVP